MFFRYERELPVETKKLSTLVAKIEGAEKKRDKIDQELNAKNQELVLIQRESDRIESGDQVSRELMKEKNKGKIPGFLGRLGDLAAIDSRYDVAISTCAGRLYNYVVDTADTAQKCIQFLKEKGLRSSTFIALDKIPSQWRTNEQYPENVSRLFDLVRYEDERVGAALYFALGETLVVDDMEQATRIGYGSRRYRVVTLKGQIVDPDGSMSGGGRPISGAIGSTISTRTSISDKSSHQQSQQLSAQVEQLKMDRSSLNQEIDSMRAEMFSLEKDIKHMQENLSAYKFEVGQNNERFQQLQQNVKKAQSELNEIEESLDLDKFEAEYQKAKKIYDVEAAKMDQQKDQLNKIDEQIQEKLNSYLEPFKKKKKAAEKKLKEAQESFNSLISEHRNSELNLEKSREALESSQSGLVKTQEEIASIEASIRELEVNAKQISQDYELSKESCEASSNQLIEINTKLSKIVEASRELQNEFIDIKHDIEKRFKVCKRFS